MNRSLTSTQKITFTALLLVLDIIGTHIIRTPSLAGFSFIRLSLGPAIVIYSSLFLGPFYGAVVGGCGDILGILLFQGLEGQINPLLTIVYTMLGILPYLLEKLAKKVRGIFNKPYAYYVGLAFMLFALVLLFYIIPSTQDYFRNGFGSTYVWAEPLIVGLTALFDVLSCVALHFSYRYFSKRNDILSGIPSPYEVACICLVVEGVLMIALKPLAFYVFYNWMATSPFPISYGVLFSCMFVFGSLNIIMNTFMTSWLLIYSRRFIGKMSV